MLLVWTAVVLQSGKKGEEEGVLVCLSADWPGLVLFRVRPAAAFVCATYYAPGSHALQLLNRIDEEVILISAPFRERGCLMTQAGRSAFICVLVFLLFFFRLALKVIGCFRYLSSWHLFFAPLVVFLITRTSTAKKVLALFFPVPPLKGCLCRRSLHPVFFFYIL